MGRGRGDLVSRLAREWGAVDQVVRYGIIFSDQGGFPAS